MWKDVPISRFIMMFVINLTPLGENPKKCCFSLCLSLCLSLSLSLSLILSLFLSFSHDRQKFIGYNKKWSTVPKCSTAQYRRVYIITQNLNRIDKRVHLSAGWGLRFSINFFVFDDGPHCTSNRKVNTFVYSSFVL